MGPASTPDFLTEAELADEIDAAPEFIRRLVAIRVLRPDAAGRFTPGDIHRAKLMYAFDHGGFGLDRVAMAMAEGIVGYEFMDRVFLPPTPRSQRTYREFRESLGERAEQLDRLIALLGLAEPSFDRHLRLDDEAMLSDFLDAWGDEPEDAWRAARLIADSTHRLTLGWTRLYWDRSILVPLAAGVDPFQVRQGLADRGAKLARLAVAMTVWLQQRYLAMAIESINAEFIERHLSEQGTAPARDTGDPAMLFADLAGYTTLT